jgi:nicotinamide mononucleotide transporter
MTPAEIVAVVLAVAYLLLAIRQNIWCWFCAGVSTAIYVWLFFGAKLYMESALNTFYFVMAIYGWYVWMSGRSDGHERPVVAWPIRTHMIAIALVIVASAASGYLLSTRTDAAKSWRTGGTGWSSMSHRYSFTGRAILSLRRCCLSSM